MSLEWQDRAACLDHDPELWHPVGKGSTPRDWEEARRICLACPVLAECREWVLSDQGHLALIAGDSMAGGWTPTQRKRLRQRPGRRRAS